MKEHKFNNRNIGLIAGILAPIVTFLIAYAIAFEGVSVHNLVNYFIKKEVFSGFLSLCVLPNLLVFFIFIWLNFLKSARGVLFSTFFIAIVVVIIKFAF